MTKASQWDKLRKVINGVRTGHVMTDEAIIEISIILGVEVATNNPFELIEMPKPDIAPTGDSRDRSGVSDEEANKRASAFADRLSRGDKLRMARIVPEAVKSDIADEEVWERQDRLRVESSTDRMTSDEEAKLDRPDEEFEMNESGGYPVLGLGLLQFGHPEKKPTNLTLHDVMDELHNYDELRLQAKRVFADLMAQVWEHFVTRACGVLSGRHPTADYFRQYVLDWFNLDIRA